MYKLQVIDKRFYTDEFFSDETELLRLPLYRIRETIASMSRPRENQEKFFDMAIMKLVGP